MGVPKKNHRVFWVRTRVSEPCKNADGVSLSHRTRGSGGVSRASPARSGAKSRPKMNLMHFICYTTLVVKENPICSSITIVTQMGLYTSLKPSV